MRTHCDECPRNQITLFCADCGKLLDRTALKSVRIDGFTGTQSMSPAMDTFWSTGDPAVFDSP